MTIRDDLKTKTIEAMKAKKEDDLLILRSISAALKDADIASRGAGKGDQIEDKDILQLLQSMIKKRRDSIDMYEKGGRQDLADKEQAQIKIIETFLPKQLSEAETKAAIKEAIAKTGAAGIKDMGKVMGVLKEAYAGQMDFGKASAWIKESF